MRPLSRCDTSSRLNPGQAPAGQAALCERWVVGPASWVDGAAAAAVDASPPPGMHNGWWSQGDGDGWTVTTASAGRKEFRKKRGWRQLHGEGRLAAGAGCRHKWGSVDWRQSRAGGEPALLSLIDASGMRRISGRLASASAAAAITSCARSGRSRASGQPCRWRRPRRCTSPRRGQRQSRARSGCRPWSRRSAGGRRRPTWCQPRPGRCRGGLPGGCASPGRRRVRARADG